jgi:hypothetical protein
LLADRWGALLADRMAGILITAMAVILRANGFTDLVTNGAAAVTGSRHVMPQTATTAATEGTLADSSEASFAFQQAEPARRRP